MLGKDEDLHGGATVFEIGQDSSLSGQSPVHFPPSDPQVQLLGFLLLFSLLELVPRLNIGDVFFKDLTASVAHFSEHHCLLSRLSLPSKNRDSRGAFFFQISSSLNRNQPASLLRLAFQKAGLDRLLEGKPSSLRVVALGGVVGGGGLSLLQKLLPEAVLFNHCIISE